MVKLQVKDDKVKYEFPIGYVEDTNFDPNQIKDLEIKYAIANEFAELNRTMKTIKLALMNMAQASSDQFYKRS